MWAVCALLLWQGRSYGVLVGGAGAVWLCAVSGTAASAGMESWPQAQLQGMSGAAAACYGHDSWQSTLTGTSRLEGKFQNGACQHGIIKVA